MVSPRPLRHDKRWLSYIGIYLLSPLSDVPPDVITFTVTVMNRGKRAATKDNEVAEVTVDMNSLKSGSGSEDWYHLTGVTPIGEWGSLRLKIRYLHDLIMPEEEYSPLKELLLDSKLEVVRALADLCHSDRNPLATSLLRVFRFDKKEADLLSTLNRLEVEREEETSTLFRAASLTTTLMDLYMKSVCTEFLHTAIFPTIHRWESWLAENEFFYISSSKMNRSQNGLSKQSKLWTKKI